MVLSRITAARLQRWRVRAARFAGPLAILCSVAYLAATLQQGWIPHDTGQLGHTAERVLQGEMQHRDFDEPYTGGLGHLHALAFRLGGVRVASMRAALLWYFALFIVAIYVIARRAASPWTAAAVTFLCACVSVPIYSEGLPSWYNLFFATLGTLALMQHATGGPRRWLFWAGCCAGCSLLIKVTGLYFVAAALIYIAWGEQQACDGQGLRDRRFSWMMTALCLLFAALGLAFVRGPSPAANVVHFTLPLAAIGAYLAWNEWKLGCGALGTRLARLTALVLPFLAGLSCLMAVFLLPYVVSGSLSDLYRGLFVLPAARLERATFGLPDLKWLALSVPVAWWAFRGTRVAGQSASRPVQGVVLLVGLALLTVASGTLDGYFYLFQSLRNLIPLIVLAGLAVLVLKRGTDGTLLFLLLTVTALSSLIQYPYSYGIYFFYAAPLLVLAVLFVVAQHARPQRQLWASLLAFAIFFALVRLPQADPRLMNGLYDPTFPVSTLHLERCRLVVYREQARAYQRLIELINDHCADEGYVYAAPDCPEVYFLSGRKNPTRTLYDIFDPQQGDRTAMILSLLQRRNIPVVVINCNPSFSPPVAPELLDALQELYPCRESIRGARYPGSPEIEWFRVFWRGTPSAPVSERLVLHTPTGRAG